MTTKEIEHLRREMEPLIKDLWCRFLKDGEFVIGPDGKFIDPNKVEITWADPVTDPRTK